MPSCYLRVTERDTDRVAALLRAFPFPVQLSREARREVYSNKDWNVLRVSIGSTLHFKTVIQRLERHLPHFVFFNSDISPQQLYLYETGLFPLAYGDYDIDGEGRLVGWTLHDAADALEYVLPR